MELFRAALRPDSDIKYAKFAATVLRYYAEPHRVYHGVDHVLLGINKAFDLAEKTDTFNFSLGQQLAWLCHDIVYVPAAPSGYNETLSTYLLCNLLRKESLFGEEIRDLHSVCDEACHIIMATIHHQPNCVASMAVIDLDLAGFAFQDLFLRNNRELAQEFGLPEQDFERGQAEFLSNLIQNRETLYCTEYAISHWEKAAQHNISGHISRIKSELG